MRYFYAKFALTALLFVTPQIVWAGDLEKAPANDARVEPATRRFDDEAPAVKNLALKYQALQEKIRQQTGLVEVTPEAVRRVIATLQEQREQLELDAAGAVGRRQALEEAVEKLSKKMQDRIASDEVARELQKVVEVRQAQLLRVKQLVAAAAAPQGDMDAAEAILASAKADLAAVRQKAMSASSAEALDGWNRQLLELSVAAREREARLHYIHGRLAQISAAMGNLDWLELIRIELTQAQHAAAKGG